ncbi:hypothetical protein MAPG_01151 [Magnaporthiopsis poae ATCC 64411]|uniref:Uncharacterized protein n=1 Tax=Magnaporthiopsis poae (strain ATCC 64411 / 73-15) TaxID=644358 RepID=A0A0C4DMY3_MAGP6|nr:hypothetical protein MAPG_01151 [Magnaporthiopsis poae ATCC 64411]
MYMIGAQGEGIGTLGRRTWKQDKTAGEPIARPGMGASRAVIKAKKTGGEPRGWGNEQSIRRQDPTLPEWPGTLSAGFCGGRQLVGASRVEWRAELSEMVRGIVADDPESGHADAPGSASSPLHNFGVRSWGRARWGHCAVMPGQARIVLVLPGHLGRTSPLWSGPWLLGKESWK